jgi:hypothetical protein
VVCVCVASVQAEEALACGVEWVSQTLAWELDVEASYVVHLSPMYSSVIIAKSSE